MTQAELGSAKEAAHHAPSRTMKVLVDKLKQQLSTKENQHQVSHSHKKIFQCIMVSVNVSVNSVSVVFE